jgi:glyoxylase I family protein
MRVKGITFVGTRTADQPTMASFVRDVLGLQPMQVNGAEADFFALPDGTTFAVSGTDGAERPERTVGFLVDNVDDAAQQLRDAGLSVDEISTTDVHRYVHFRAPDGRLYELVEDLRSVRGGP